MVRSLNPNYMHVGFNLGKGGCQVGAFNDRRDEQDSSLMHCARVSSVICLGFRLVRREVHAPGFGDAHTLVGIYNASHTETVTGMPSFLYSSTS